MYKRFGKRLIDTVLSLIAFIILSPLLLITALAVKISSRGPVLFKQQRLGLHGKVFTIYKFRSMSDGAEHTGSGVYSGNGDPRVTKVGKIIRATSIDELPQFINVLKGDMSLVGTRPPTVAEFKQYQGHHKRRLSMKPGITGMWQAYGRKTVSDFEEIVKMDLNYIDNWSIMLDIKILFKTVQSVLTTGGQ